MRNTKKYGGGRAAGRAAGRAPPAAKWKQDWNWVDNVAEPGDITPALRRRAAGLAPAPACPLPRVRWGSGSARAPDGPADAAADAPGSSEDRQLGAAIDVDDDDTGEGSSTASALDVPRANGAACTAKRCRNAPRCYSHLGFEKVRTRPWRRRQTDPGRRPRTPDTDAQWAEDDAKAKYVEANAGEELVFRDGPAGLCNYGATCYVS